MALHNASLEVAKFLLDAGADVIKIGCRLLDRFRRRRRQLARYPACRPLSRNEHGGWIQVSQHNGKPGARVYVDNYTGTKTAGIVETWDAKGETAVVLASGDEEGRAVSMGANVRGGVIGLFRDGKQHLLDPLKLDELKTALRGDDQ